MAELEIDSGDWNHVDKREQERIDKLLHICDKSAGLFRFEPPGQNLHCTICDVDLPNCVDTESVDSTVYQHLQTVRHQKAENERLHKSKKRGRPRKKTSQSSAHKKRIKNTQDQKANSAKENATNRSDDMFVIQNTPVPIYNSSNAASNESPKFIRSGLWRDLRDEERIQIETLRNVVDEHSGMLKLTPRNQNLFCTICDVELAHCPDYNLIRPMVSAHFLSVEHRQAFFAQNQRRYQTLTKLVGEQIAEGLFNQLSNTTVCCMLCGAKALPFSDSLSAIKEHCLSAEHRIQTIHRKMLQSCNANDAKTIKLISNKRSLLRIQDMLDRYPQMLRLAGDSIECLRCRCKFSAYYSNIKAHLQSNRHERASRELQNITTTATVSRDLHGPIANVVRAKVDERSVQQQQATSNMIVLNCANTNNDSISLSNNIIVHNKQNIDALEHNYGSNTNSGVKSEHAVIVNDHDYSNRSLAGHANLSSPLSIVTIPPVLLANIAPVSSILPAANAPKVAKQVECITLDDDANDDNGNQDNMDTLIDTTTDAAILDEHEQNEAVLLLDQLLSAAST